MFDYNNEFENGEVVCDCCDCSETFDGDFYQCVERMKEVGWYIRKIKEEWYHFCNKECYLKAKEKGVI